MSHQSSSQSASTDGVFYELFCYVISAVFACVATVMLLDSNQAFVWPVAGYVVSLLFGWNAHRSSWHPLRDLQTE